MTKFVLRTADHWWMRYAAVEVNERGYGNDRAWFHDLKDAEAYINWRNGKKRNPSAK